MTDQSSGQAALSAAVNTFFSKQILKDFEPMTQFFANAPMRESIPMGGGNIIEFTRYRKIPALFSDDTDEFTAQQMFLSASTIQATLHERDGFVQLSRFVSLTAIGNVLQRAAEKVTSAGAKTIDKLIRNDTGMIVADKAVFSANMFDNMAIDGGTLNSTGITARVWTQRSDGFPLRHNKTRVAQSSTVVSFAASSMTILTLQDAVSVLEANDVDLIGGNYKLIAHPDVTFQLTTQAGFKGWFAPTTSEPAENRPAEVGVVAGVKIFNSTQAYKFPLSGDTLSTSSGNLYGSLLFGDEAYGVSDISGNNGGRKGFMFFLKESGPQSTNDPTNKRKQAGFSVTAVGQVLNKSAGLWILTTKV